MQFLKTVIFENNKDYYCKYFIIEHGLFQWSSFRFLVIDHNQTRSNYFDFAFAHQPDFEFDIKSDKNPC